MGGFVLSCFREQPVGRLALTKANTRRPGRGAGGPLSQIDGGKGCYVIDRNPACADKLHFYDKPLRPRGL